MRAEIPHHSHHEPGAAQCAWSEPALDRLHAALVAARWSPRALSDALPQIAAHAHELVPQSRLAWLAGLREATRHAWALPGPSFERLFALAGAWGDWPLVAALGERYAERGARAAWAESLRVDAVLRLGEDDAALALCRSRMLSHPQESWPADIHAALLRWREFKARRAPAIDGETLRLEPLGHHHVDDFARQYYDPAIAELCCLPAFADEVRWHRWLDECWSYGDQRLYAVLHAEWGFVGSVSLVLHDGVGFFYYWLGRDFQGHGLGPAAVRLLLDDAFARGRMTVCYAKVFVRNTPSRRAMEKLGFVAMDFELAPPNDDEMIYRLGADRSREQDVEHLRWLLERMGSDTRIAVPLRAQHVGMGCGPVGRRA